MSKSFSGAARCAANALACAAIALPATNALQAQSVPEFDADQRGVEVDFGEVELRVGGRMHIDTLVTPDLFGDDEVDFRRARVEVGLDLPEDFRVRADYEFAGASGWRNVWIDYRGIEGVGIRAGQFVVPFNIEDMQQSNDLLFMERALPSALAPSFAVGAAASARPGNWTLTGGVFLDPIDDNSDRDDGVSYVGRAVFRPVDERRRVVHLGIAVEHRDYDEGASTRFGASQEGTLSSEQRLRTPTFRDAASSTAVSTEAIMIDGPLLLQAQAIGRRVNRLENSDPTLWGAYVQAGWLFGEGRRRYSRGLGAPSAIDVDRGDPVFEIGLRASYLDLEEEGSPGGREFNLGAAFSYYIDDNVRLAANIIKVWQRPDRIGSDESGLIFQTRFQVRF